MDEESLKQRVIANLPGRPAKFDPFTLMVLLAIVSGAIQWLAKRCLDWLYPAKIRDPGVRGLRRLHKAIRYGCAVAAELPEVKAAGMSEAELEALHGDALHAAFLATGKQIEPTELAAFRATYAPPALPGESTP